LCRRCPRPNVHVGVTSFCFLLAVLFLILISCSLHLNFPSLQFVFLRLFQRSSDHGSSQSCPQRVKLVVVRLSLPLCICQIRSRLVPLPLFSFLVLPSFQTFGSLTLSVVCFVRVSSKELICAIVWTRCPSCRSFFFSFFRTFVNPFLVRLLFPSFSHPQFSSCDLQDLKKSAYVVVLIA